MGRMEMDPPPPGTPGVVDLPLWLLIPLGLMWVYFAWREPNDDKRHHDGWFVLPSIISIMAFVGVAWLGLT